MPDGWLLATGGLVVLAVVAIVRWLLVLQRRLNDHAERLARVEGWQARDDSAGRGG